MIKEITTYISTNITGLTIGKNLFSGYVPSTIEIPYIVLVETGGKTYPDLKDYVEKSLQVLSVARDYMQARDYANAVYSLLHSAAGITLPVIVAGSEYYINTIIAVTFPQSLGQDEKGNFIISTNYVLRIQDKP